MMFFDFVNSSLLLFGMIVFGIAFIFTDLFVPTWAQEPESFGKGVLEDPASLFNPDNRGFAFLMFIVGIAIYSLFIWYFYRFISKRDLFPRLFYAFFQHNKKENVSKAKTVGFAVSYVLLFPLVIFAWFTVLSFFVFLIGENMPFRLALFISLAIIGVVRILAYYREDAAKEVAKMIPYAILSFLLTSAAVYANPNFITEKQIQTIPFQFTEHFEGIVAAILLISVFEFSFRITFIVKRRFLPVPEKILEDEVESQVESITKAHFQKMEQKEKELENKIDELLKKLKDSEKTDF